MYRYVAPPSAQCYYAFQQATLLRRVNKHHLIEDDKHGVRRFALRSRPRPRPLLRLLPRHRRSFLRDIFQPYHVLIRI